MHNRLKTWQLLLITNTFLSLQLNYKYIKYYLHIKISIIHDACRTNRKQKWTGRKMETLCNLYRSNRAKWAFALFVPRRLLRQVTSEVTDTRQNLNVCAGARMASLFNPNGLSRSAVMEHLQPPRISGVRDIIERDPFLHPHLPPPLFHVSAVLP